MKKLINIILCFLFSVLGVNAQSQVATLQHNGELSVFYGSLALKDACQTAEDGDLITLSDGSFLGCEITKRLTIRGVGATTSKVSGMPATIIADYITLNLTSESDKSLLFEGILFKEGLKSSYGCKTLKNVQFVKCTLCEFTPGYSGTNFENVSFINCRLNKASVNMATFINSVVFNSKGDSSEFNNCVVIYTANGLRTSSSTFNNCLIYNTDNSIYADGYSASNNYTSCVACSISSKNPFTNGIGSNTYLFTSSFKSLFEDAEINLGDYLNSDYKLTAEAQATYLGTDGQQVGLYGGAMPFNEILDIPLITKFNVAPKTTVDGKLSIELEVTSGE